MIQEHFTDIKAAEARVRQLLRENTPSPSPINEYTFTETELKDEEDPKRTTSKVRMITLEGSEDYALIKTDKYRSYSGLPLESASIMYVEAGNRYTFPYRTAERLDFLNFYKTVFGGYAVFVKPDEAMTADEANSAAGEEKLRHFFGKLEYTAAEQAEALREIKAGKRSLFHAEPDEDEATGFLYRTDIEISPAVFRTEEHATIKKAEHYLDAIEKVIGRKLCLEEVGIALQTYYRKQIELYFMYVLYSFLYAEQNEALQKAIKERSKFGLPKGFEQKHKELLPYDNIEEAVVNCYYEELLLSEVCKTSRKNIADYTLFP